VLAVTDLSPYAIVGAEHNSNVFSRPSGQPPFAGTGNTELGDTVVRYVVGATADFGWGLDDLRLNAEGRRLDYNRFNVLNHDEHKLAADLDWHFGSVVETTFDFLQTRIMSALADTLSDQLELQTDRSVSSTVRILVTPQWRVDLQPRWHQLDSPLPLYPDFGLQESAAAASINYLGIAKLTAGLRFEYLDGAYHHILAATNYHQNTEQLTASYAVTGLSSFDGQVGYTQRDSSLRNPADAASVGGPGGVSGTTTALTGALGFHRELTVKTSVNLRVFREIDSYVAGANSQIGTGGEASLTWKPDVKFAVSLRYRQMTQNIEGNLQIANFINRSDRVHTGALEVSYFATSWLTFRPYVTHDERSSNFAQARYTSTLFGIDLTGRLK